MDCKTAVAKDRPGGSPQPPLAGTTCGRPTTVTSMPASSRRLRDPLHVGHGHGLHQAVALVDVIDAETFALDLHELRGNLAGGIEAQRVGTRQEGLRLGEFLFGRAVLGEATDFGLEHIERLPGAIGAGRGAGHEQRGVLERDQALNTE